MTPSGLAGQWRPDYAIPPGDVLKEVLAAQGMSQAELATRTGLSAKHINQVIRGLVPLSADVALVLERVLGTPSYVWNGIEAQYRDAAVRQTAHKQLERHIGWAKLFPSADLQAHGIVQKSDKTIARVDKILAFFKVADPPAFERLWGEPVAAFRRSQKVDADLYATATWLRLAEIAAAELPLAPYDSSRFQKLVPQLRELTIPPLNAVFAELQQRCAQAGVAVVRVAHIAKTRASGATRWISSAYPIIVLSGRYKMEDSLWFSFFHEAGHVILHPKRATYIAPDHHRDEVDVLETDADNFARKTLIPSDLDGQLPRLTTKAAVEHFAQNAGVGTGIVAGRLMTDGLLKWSSSGLRRKLD